MGRAAWGVGSLALLHLFANLEREIAKQNRIFATVVIFNHV